jgi:lactate dehydrogenase-like 2-hydroxyacid dehydrogenase
VRDTVSRPRIFAAYPAPDFILSALSEVGELSVWRGPGRPTLEDLASELSDVEAVYGNLRWTEETFALAPKLRVIANTSVGFDNVDVAAATAHGVIVTNTPDVLTDTTADLAFSLLVAAARRIGEAERFVRAGLWGKPGQYPGFLGRDIHHATLGIVGLGRIGAEVAHRGLGFHMNVIYHDALRREDLERQHGYRFVDLDTLLRESDFVSLHVSLSAETMHLIGAGELAKMKPTAILVNASRGGVVDEQALISALREGQLAGAGLDVFEKEPVDPDNPLLKMENVVVTSHIGSATLATRQAMGRLAAANVVAVLQGKPPLTPVNPEVVGRTLA